jgi:4-hydroxy-3-methylbut-2-en-1-yl diphosphate reductase
MHIILANPRGFCAGVNMAIESLNRAIDLFGTPLYVYHEIVHNRPIVEQFTARGVVFVDDITDVPVGQTVLYSAHGVAPVIRTVSAERNLRAIDATCPLVTKVHMEAVKLAKDGYTIFLIGHDGHEEVIGTMGEAPDHMILVEDAAAVAGLTEPANPKLAYLTQTTLSVDEANAVIAALKERFPHIVGPSKDDICYATQNRQEAVRAMVPDADAVIVVGSRNSSNSNRLAELARSKGKPAYLIDRATELKAEWFQPTDTVVLTAGASAPEEYVQDCVRWLTDTFGATVESRTIREEHVSFPLPRELRVLAKA